MFGQQKQILDKHGIGCNENNNEIILVKPNTLGKNLFQVLIRNLFLCFFMRRTDHLRYTYPSKNPNAKCQKTEMGCPE